MNKSESNIKPYNLVNTVNNNNNNNKNSNLINTYLCVSN